MKPAPHPHDSSMKSNPPISPESAGRLRELYRKNLLAAIVLTPESLAREFPELTALANPSAPPRAEAQPPPGGPAGAPPAANP